jgi:hypothetical protein
LRTGPTDWLTSFNSLKGFIVPSEPQPAINLSVSARSEGNTAKFQVTSPAFIAPLTVRESLF